jgi:DNA-directed RNA polymerase specialized sigma24 family protein
MPAQSEPLLTKSWPEFLDRLDSDRDTALRHLHAFTVQLLTVCPPEALRRAPAGMRQDLIAEVFWHCVADDCRVLRSYHDRGTPFARWLLLVARNRIHDCTKAMKNRILAGAAITTDPRWTVDVIEDQHPLQDVQRKHRLLLSHVRERIATMRRECQLLLWGSAEGLSPAEMTLLLGWPTNWNKKASDALRECRNRLRSLLHRDGIDPGELLGR